MEPSQDGKCERNEQMEENKQKHLMERNAQRNDPCKVERHQKESEMVWCTGTRIHVFISFCAPSSLLSHCSSVQTMLIIALRNPVARGDCERSLSLSPACTREKMFSLWENQGMEQLKSLDQSHFFAFAT